MNSRPIETKKCSPAGIPRTKVPFGRKTETHRHTPSTLEKGYVLRLRQEAESKVGGNS